MAADQSIDLVVNQKSSFTATFIVKASGVALDLTGYTVDAKMKKSYEEADANAISFTAAISDALAGKVTISLSSAQTAALSLIPYVYDVAITQTSSSFKTRIVEGKIKVSGGVA